MDELEKPFYYFVFCVFHNSYNFAISNEWKYLESIIFGGNVFQGDLLRHEKNLGNSKI